VSLTLGVKTMIPNPDAAGTAPSLIDPWVPAEGKTLGDLPVGAWFAVEKEPHTAWEVTGPPLSDGTVPYKVVWNPDHPETLGVTNESLGSLSVTHYKLPAGAEMLPPGHSHEEQVKASSETLAKLPPLTSTYPLSISDIDPKINDYLVANGVAYQVSGFVPHPKDGTADVLLINLENGTQVKVPPSFKPTSWAGGSTVPPPLPPSGFYSGPTAGAWQIKNMPVGSKFMLHNVPYTVVAHEPMLGKSDKSHTHLVSDDGDDVWYPDDSITASSHWFPLLDEPAGPSNAEIAAGMANLIGSEIDAQHLKPGEHFAYGASAKPYVVVDVNGIGTVKALPVSSSDLHDPIFVNGHTKVQKIPPGSVQLPMADLGPGQKFTVGSGVWGQGGQVWQINSPPEDDEDAHKLWATNLATGEPEWFGDELPVTPLPDWTEVPQEEQAQDGATVETLDLVPGDLYKTSAGNTYKVLSKTADGGVEVKLMDTEAVHLFKDKIGQNFTILPGGAIGVKVGHEAPGGDASLTEPVPIDMWDMQPGDLVQRTLKPTDLPDNKPAVWKVLSKDENGEVYMEIATPADQGYQVGYKTSFDANDQQPGVTWSKVGETTPPGKERLVALKDVEVGELVQSKKGDDLAPDETPAIWKVVSKDPETGYVKLQIETPFLKAGVPKYGGANEGSQLDVPDQDVKWEVMGSDPNAVLNGPLQPFKWSKSGHTKYHLLGKLAEGDKFYDAKKQAFTVTKTEATGAVKGYVHYKDAAGNEFIAPSKGAYVRVATP
jgi:hypothetical protein